MHARARSHRCAARRLRGSADGYRSHRAVADRRSPIGACAAARCFADRRTRPAGIVSRRRSCARPPLRDGYSTSPLISRIGCSFGIRSAGDTRQRIEAVVLLATTHRPLERTTRQPCGGSGQVIEGGDFFNSLLSKSLLLSQVLHIGMQFHGGLKVFMNGSAVA